ncbi:MULTISPECIES: transcription elongation factor GreA [unclassified Methylophaga]|jgi:transcription elongation factor GreA|uniref:transcription elongation factor GreA n=1 Tax=unclassified Methylophaga TaxID=2629249 RepID=UPI000C8B7A95|nr:MULTISPECIES: transcription elongation factor GreA [unclassified Methylophaga]MAK66460.1 transcription elongation factor GreA [Methylophaga sp.]MAY17154.1 transcription elongation factor GreA [Methylophaga sp.]HAO23502.1 transcription elongation factor GreA [Methylophaga sp.]HCD04121.1 transcription elongation factor GreA [Methylophaga sp.]|tara:strand:+ start:14714 stop:15190 length:477 start_codon:yes stop_codon:yes gene_type:complete
MAVPITQRGAQALKDELHELKTIRRPAIVNAISEARAHGDLKENAEYHAAREQQSFTEGRIQELESTLADCQVIDPTALPKDGRVVFGVTVDLLNIDTDDEVRYQIVGDYESDIKLNRISISSPIARALIGKEVDDIATVQAPGGAIEYEITGIHYLD